MTSLESRPAIDFRNTRLNVQPAGRCAVAARNITKSFRENVALKEASFSVDEGEMVALVGASGSGKSTLLRCLNGLLQADEGTVEILGTPLQSGGKMHSKVRRLRAQVGFIFQQFNLVTRLSVLDNVLIGSLSQVSALKSAFRIFSREEKTRALAALERVGILEQAYKRAASLSGGQQQRVAIARCLMQKASVILADEPIASLDPESAHRVMKLLRDLNQEQGITVITSLHQVQMVRAYFPRAIALQNGAVKFDGQTADLTSERLSRIYGAAAEELVERGHGDFD